MLICAKHLSRCSVTAADGPVGQVKAVLFDDQSWAIRYLLVSGGEELDGREVLISPYSVKQPLTMDRNIDVLLSRDQIRESPQIDTNQPVSPQYERKYLKYYTYPEYWDGSALWASEGLPVLPPTRRDDVTLSAQKDSEAGAGDVHLRNSAEICGYEIEAQDGIIGHVADFVFDSVSWAVRYLVVDTHNWWPGGDHVLVSPKSIDGIDWSANTVQVRLTRRQIQKSPSYDDSTVISREYEARVQDAQRIVAYSVHETGSSLVSPKRRSQQNAEEKRRY